MTLSWKQCLFYLIIILFDLSGGYNIIKEIHNHNETDWKQKAFNMDKGQEISKPKGMLCNTQT